MLGGTLMTKADLLRPLPLRLHTVICICYLLWMGFLNIYDYGWQHLPIVLPIGILILLTVYLHRYLLRQILYDTLRLRHILIGLGVFIVLISAVYILLYCFPNRITGLLRPDPSAAPDLPGYVIGFLMVYGTSVFRGVGLAMMEVLYNIVSHLSGRWSVPKEIEKKKPVRKKSKTSKLLHTLTYIAKLLETLFHEKSALSAQKEDNDPEHVTVDWILNFLQIHRSNFYRNVNDKLIKPVLHVGKRPYYLKKEVLQLLKPHETGAHTYAKAKKKVQTSK